MSRSGIVNVRMVITEEKILSNIDKVKKLINPNSKKQIIQLEEDAYFKNLIESIKTYLIEYPKKKNFPKGVYKAAYQLVEYTTSEFEENTRKIEELIRQRETNISLAAKLKKTLNMIVNKEENWKQALKEISNDFSEDIVDTLSLIGRAKSKKSQNCQDAMKLINARIAIIDIPIPIVLHNFFSSYFSFSSFEAVLYPEMNPLPCPESKIIESTANIAKTIHTIQSEPVAKSANFIYVLLLKFHFLNFINLN